MQLFDEVEDFGAFDDAVSGDVRDPYIGAANRDEQRCKDPDRFDIFRSPTSLPVLFGPSAS